MTIEEITGKHYNKFIVWYQTNYQGITTPSLREFERLPFDFQMGVLSSFLWFLAEGELPLYNEEDLNWLKEDFEQID